MTEDERYMLRALELAEKGRGLTAPNPLVGAVLVHNHHIIGEGFHRLFGEAHAEVNAVKSVHLDHRDSIDQSTLYVNLEPCSHHGKTPPCTDLILKHRIPKVAIANVDPGPEVDGKGVKYLRENGVEVTTGLLEEQGRELNKTYFTYHQKQRPYIILKWAQTEDALIAPPGKRQEWISGNLSQRLAHRWRGQEQAIMVGTETAAIDNPSLTTRLWTGKNPMRIVIDRHLRLDQELNIFNKEAKTVVYTASQEPPSPRHSHLRFVSLEPAGMFLQQVVDHLYSQKIQSVMVEGGSKLLASMIEAGLWDEARVFVGRRYFGEGVPAPRLPLEPSSRERVGQDDLLIFYHHSNQSQ